MAEVLRITPERFIASGGKLDTDKRYVGKTLGAGYEWPGPSTETLYLSGGNVGYKNRQLIGGYNPNWQDPSAFYLSL